ncbi:hypothetical protein [Prevotella sp.]|nr:hypothetical protein [Prevotella sp.]
MADYQLIVPKEKLQKVFADEIKALSEEFSFYLTFEKIYPEVLFYGTSGRVFMLFGVLLDSNIRKLYYERLPPL